VPCGTWSGKRRGIRRKEAGNKAERGGAGGGAGARAGPAGGREVPVGGEGGVAGGVGGGEVMREAGLLLSWLDWVEEEVWRFDDVVEVLHRLRGAVMVVAALEKRKVSESRFGITISISDLELSPSDSIP
jgi:hypothetical protein